MPCNNNNNTHICIAPYGRKFRGAVARELVIFFKLAV